MKNIHLIATDKPSRLYKARTGGYGLYNEPKIYTVKNQGQNIYITNTERIKEGDWVITGNGLLAKVTTNFTWHFISSKKIILTTDEDLIADNIQVIDYKFLEWFVQNPDSEYVKIEKIKQYKGNYLDCFHTQGQCDCGLKTCKQIFFLLIK